MNDSETLLCQEDETCLNENNYKLGLCSVSECDDEDIQTLIRREAVTFQSNSTFSLLKSEKSWFKCARLDVIKWILNTRAFFGFHFRTAYLSLIYFDEFFSKRSIDDGKLWAIRLLSVACLSLAAKMEEFKAPALSDYHVDDYNFEGHVIQRMELLVLSTLEWNMSLITPFAYLNYFTTKFCGECSHKKLVTRAIELIFTIIKEINVVENRPSIIAAAVVLAAYDYQLTKKVLEIKVNTISSWGSLEIEIGMLESKTPNSVIPPNIFSTLLSSTGVLESSSLSTAGSKRTLTYPDNDQDCPAQKIPRIC
ncbi:cyclin-D5-1-like isoform X2 [Olea europaea var. sylvestris]|uniref:Cyclin-D5-1-like isoform X1 n=1 Tax=Olea europaea subsp. europaea TaxID=158383 RepID=A0A8S0Q2X8_OLEEU|nr:cyclin-D5-1-like isoform X2 [Olea europaea var. sylvestris]CAA2961278.1 cyclin-D5-1-like isoform X1 [Olea europaea subsp. europaea]